jgi:2-polyprenyl-3-methyl-5-hydroxy-6-metoxy-1,4-benzoquinol methylase
VEDQAAFWDDQASSFDREPDHGLLDPAVHDAWATLLASLLPDRPSRVVDLGCGTGTLSVLLAQQGHEVTGIDISPKMLEVAREKARAASVRVDFEVADASVAPLDRGGFDVVLARHVLWAFPDPSLVVGRWIELLNDAGRLVLVEGRWFTGAGLTAAQMLALVRAHGRDAQAIPLASEAYWGGAIEDERYVVVSPPASAPV